MLVLVDGDGYLFKDSLVKAGSDGGITAANLLSDSIKDLIHDQVGGQGEHCRIMVRIYSNLLGLSKALARSGLVGHEARALSPFTASFTRAQELFDWVDSDNKKEGADFKIRGTNIDWALQSMTNPSQKCSDYLPTTASVNTSSLQAVTIPVTCLCSHPIVGRLTG